MKTFFLAVAFTLVAFGASAQCYPGHWSPYGVWVPGGCPSYLAPYYAAPYPGWVYAPRWGWHAPGRFMYWHPHYGWRRHWR